MMVATLSLCLCCSRCFAALVLCSAHLHIACMQLLHLAVLPSRSIARLLMSQTRRDSSPSHVLPDTCLDDTPHKFLGAVNNDKNCLLSHSFPTKALSQSFTHSLLLAHSLVELCVRSMSFRLCPPSLTHSGTLLSCSLSLVLSLLLHISAVACIDFVYRERRTTPPPPPLPLFIQ